ncbi:MAG TPA: GAF domain-containing protein [Bacteroidetes bacterium]|nr:GAF domain-containing protein [Bacteroidota bacterium]
MKSTGTERAGFEKLIASSGRGWAEKRVFQELTTTLKSAEKELKSLPAGTVPEERLRALESQLSRLAHLLEHIEEVQRTRLEIHLITQIALSLANALDLQEVLSLIVDSLKQVVDYDAAGIFVVSKDGEEVEGEILRGYETSDRGRIRQKLGQGLMGWAMENMAPVVVADVSRDPRYIMARSSTRSELVVPMFTQGRVVGCLNLESDNLGAYSERDADHLMTFASHAAVAIERARLHREILEKQRMDEELALARRMQRDLLPRSAPKFDRFDIAGVNLPSEMVGGDYYDYIQLTEKDLGIVVGDVAGKGVPAAFIMTSLRAALRIEAFSHYAISTILSRVNDYLCGSTKPEIFVTAFYGVLDTRSGILTYANAGHNPPLLLRADHSRETLSEGGMLLGAFPNALYHEHRVTLAANDILVLYTDGASEAENRAGEQFGVERIEEIVRSAATKGPRQIIRQLLRLIRGHCGEIGLQDDITLVVIQCR